MVLERKHDRGREHPEDAGRDIDLGHARYARRVLVTTAIITPVVLMLLLLWYMIDVLLLVFAGVLLAVFLRGLGDWLSEHTRLSEGWSLAVVVLGLIALIGLGTWLLMPAIATQFDQLTEQIPQAVRQLTQRVEEYQWGRRLLAQAPAADDLAPDSGDMLSQVTGVFSTMFGAIANGVIILFIGLYLAINPDLYRQGLVRLVPRNKRRRAQEVLHTLGYTLRRWLLGQLFSMCVVGVSTALGLWFLDVPLALALGMLAGLLEFVPTIGPFLAAVPAILLALLDSPTQAFYVALLYVAIQQLESYLLMPIVQQHAVALPPVLTIVAQIVLGVLLGFLGLFLATPLAAIALVLVKMLYVEDVLGDESIEVAGEQEAQRQHEATPA